MAGKLYHSCGSGGGCPTSAKHTVNISNVVAIGVNQVAGVSENDQVTLSNICTYRTAALCNTYQVNVLKSRATTRLARPRVEAVRLSPRGGLSGIVSHPGGSGRAGSGVARSLASSRTMITAATMANGRSEQGPTR